MENTSTISRINCELCNKDFSQKSSRNRHVREVHLQPNLYPCKECGSSFAKFYNLQVHIKHVHKKNFRQKKWSQSNCIFTKSSLLKNRGKDHHKILLVSSNASTHNCEETDAQTLAKSVLNELKQLQYDISEKVQPKNLEKKPDVASIETVTAKVKTVKDNLYPLGHCTLLKTQIIKRLDGFKYLICEFCGKEFKKSYNYLRHRRVHTKVRPFVCVLCKKTFPTIAQLKAHCTIHKLHERFGLFRKLYNCPNCNEGFSAIQQLDKHLNSASDCNVTFKCPSCLKSFTTLKSLLRHKHPEKDFEVELLKKILPQPLAVSENVKISTSDISSEECHFCGIQVDQGIFFKHHVKRHENLFKNQCIKCKCTFATQSALKNHNKIHFKVKNFKCQYCVKWFSTSQNCRRHMTAHLKRWLKPHEELQDQSDTLMLFPTYIENGKNQNTETTTSIITLRKKCSKKESISATKRTHKCSKCDLSFQYKSQLKKHFKYKHTTDFPYKCISCSKEFRTKQSLKTHHLVHSKERVKITCQVCGRQYASSKSLKLHLRIHTQEKPFNCGVCGKLFRTSGHLIQHHKSNHKEEH